MSNKPTLREILGEEDWKHSEKPARIAQLIADIIGERTEPVNPHLGLVHPQEAQDRLRHHQRQRAKERGITL